MKRSALPICVGLLALALARPATAQEAPPAPCEVVQALLRQAQASGALTRVLDTTYLLCEEPGQEGLLELRCELVGISPEHPTGLRCTAIVRRGDEPARTFVQEIGFDGRLRLARSPGVAPGLHGKRERVEAGGTELTRAGAVVERVVRRGADEQRDQLEWSDRVLPGLIVGFVLTQLFDQGLPEDFAFSLCNGVALEDTDTRLTSGGLDDEGRRIFNCVTQVGNAGLVRYNVAVVNDGERKGELLGGRFDVWSREAPLFRVISAEEAAALQGGD